MSERRDWLAPALVAAAAAAAFAPAAALPFLDWDDGTNVLANARLAFDAEGWRWMLSGSALGHWHPLTWLSLALDRALWGADPMGFHATSVALHAANAALFHLLARRLLPGSELGAAFASLFWALHPLRVESVAWVSERRDVLCAAFVLGSLLAWSRDRRALALALGSAAMASKVFAVMLPAALLLLDVHIRGRARWRPLALFAPPAALALALNLRAQAESGAAVSLADFGLFPRLAQAVYGLAFYPAKTLLPFGLSPLYERSLLLEPAPFVAAFIAAGLAAAALWSARERRPGLVLLALAYLVFLLPALGLFKSGRMSAADRYSYMPGWALSLLAGAALTSAVRGHAPKLAAFSLLIALAGLTRLQLPVWSSDIALWTRACESSPLSYFARLKLARALDSAGRPAEAAAERSRAQALHREVFTRAALAYERRGDAAAAASARARAERGLAL